MSAMPGSLPLLSADALDPVAAVDALERALLGGLDVDADPPRTSLPVGDGELLVMPSSLGAVKLVSIGGRAAGLDLRPRATGHGTRQGAAGGGAVAGRC
jgi:hypothetical protein